MFFEYALGLIMRNMRLYLYIFLILCATLSVGKVGAQTAGTDDESTPFRARTGIMIAPWIVHTPVGVNTFNPDPALAVHLDIVYTLPLVNDIIDFGIGIGTRPSILRTIPYDTIAGISNDNLDFWLIPVYAIFGLTIQIPQYRFLNIFADMGVGYTFIIGSEEYRQTIFDLMEDVGSIYINVLLGGELKFDNAIALYVAYAIDATGIFMISRVGDISYGFVGGVRFTF